jgi:hypothetical protein
MKMRMKLQGSRHYYAGHNCYGVNNSYDGDGWSAYAFDTRAERDQWLEENEYWDGRQVAEAITAKDAYKIAGVSSGDELYQDTGSNLALCAEF